MIKTNLLHRTVINILTLILLIIPSYSYTENAPDFSLNDEENNSLRPLDFKGKPLILFFFSFSCGHCEKSMSIVNELYKKYGYKYNILGVVNGVSKEDLKYKKMEASIEFPVAFGTDSIRRDYSISGTPYLWVISHDGTMVERFVGQKGAELLKEWLKIKVGVGLHELFSFAKNYEGKDIEVGGLLIQTSPSYFPTPMFAITNGSDKVHVSAWLPLEISPSPKGLKKHRKKVMSDFLDKYVIISGKVVLEDGKPMIEVKDAKAVD